MKKPNFFTRFLILLSFVLTIHSTQSQIAITSGTSITANDLVESIITEGITYYNAQFIGHESSKGIFSNGSSTNLGLNQGIFLSTGYATGLQGPNTSGSTSGNMGITAPPHPFIFPNAFDPAVLSFNVIPETDTLRITYVFGSEEYNEWVGATYNDVFGIFISGTNPSGGIYNKKNIALVPGTATTEVSINNVNNGIAPVGVVPTGPCTNCDYFTDNTGGLTIEYDGFTVVMTAWALVVPCEAYEIIMGVADTGDFSGDTGVAIEENSIGFPEITVELVLDPPDISDIMVEGCVSGEVIFRLPHAGYSPYTLCFDIQGTATNGVDYEYIDNCVTFQAGYDTASIKIVPLYDGLIEGLESIILIPENTMGCVVRYDTITIYFDDYIDMVSVTSPDPVICPGQETDIWVTVYNGFEPQPITWEPGTFSGDTITVSPDTTTMYYATIFDMCMDSIVDSVLVTVLPGHLNEMLEFSFEASNNPILTEDVTGTISGDSVFLMLPSAQGIDNLIATFISSNCAETYVGNEVQISGETANDFTFPVIYEVMAANGDIKEWVVKVDFLSGEKEWGYDPIIIYPNPAKDVLHVTGAAGYEVSLFNAFGVNLLQETITDSNTSLDIKNLQPGICYLKFSNGDHEFVRKVVITQ
ncbi:MAG: choice-of-anchor L domain-containing protein [Bacteroidales bacterium]